MTATGAVAEVVTGPAERPVFSAGSAPPRL